MKTEVRRWSSESGMTVYRIVQDGDQDHRSIEWCRGENGVADERWRLCGDNVAACYEILRLAKLEGEYEIFIAELIGALGLDREAMDREKVTPGNVILPMVRMLMGAAKADRAQVRGELLAVVSRLWRPTGKGKAVDAEELLREIHRICPSSGTAREAEIERAAAGLSPVPKGEGAEGARAERQRIREELWDWLVGDIVPAKDAGRVGGRRIVEEINRICPEEPREDRAPQEGQAREAGFPWLATGDRRAMAYEALCAEEAEEGQGNA